MWASPLQDLGTAFMDDEEDWDAADVDDDMLIMEASID